MKRRQCDLETGRRGGYHVVAETVRPFQRAGIGAVSQVMAFLRIGLEPLTMKELAEFCECSTAGATLIVDRLTVLGLVEREPVPGDRRMWLLRVTQKGVDLMAESMSKVEGGAA